MCAVTMARETHTIQDVATILQVNRKTVRKLIDTGKLVAFRVGREYRITDRDLRDYIRRERVTPKMGDDR